VPVLEVSHLRKVYGDQTAVDDVSFQIAAGEIVGLLGPKWRRQDHDHQHDPRCAGAVRGLGGTSRVSMSPPAIRGAAAHELRRRLCAAAGNLTVEHNLRIFGLIYGVPNLAAEIDRVVAEFDLQRFRRTKCGLLSSGEQTRVSLAKALLNAPTLLLLDEPTASLDPATAHDLRGRIRELTTRSGTGVLWTSHNMSEVEAVCDRVLFLSRGRILLEGNPRTLPHEHGKSTLEDLFITVAREPLSLESEA
jgi:ABC-2 type transport system ATP-binding protein